MGFKQQNNDSGFNNFVDVIAGAIQGVSNLGTAGINLANKQGLQGDVKAACGNKPIFNIGGKKDAYLKCAAQFTANQLNTQRRLAAAESATAAAALAQQQRGGMSTGAVIGLIGGGTLVVGTLLYFLIRK